MQVIFWFPSGEAVHHAVSPKPLLMLTPCNGNRCAAFGELPSAQQREDAPPSYDAPYEEGPQSRVPAGGLLIPSFSALFS
jgi:hypothetical protein